MIAQSIRNKINAIITALFLIPSLTFGAEGNFRSIGKASIPTFVTGALGTIDPGSPTKLRDSSLSALNTVLRERFGASGDEEMLISKVSRDNRDKLHIRFKQKFNGLPVAGAGMVLHAHADGSVFAVNGDFIPSEELPRAPVLSAVEAFAKAGFQVIGTQTVLSYVLGSDGRGHLAWKGTHEYTNDAGPQRDILFVDTTTGKIAARHPQIMYARSLRTQDCGQKTSRCKNISTSPDEINTGDQAVDDAHNYAFATYNYYSVNHSRDSIDGNGMTLISRVHYSRNYNNAFWDGRQMTYGDGDGVTFAPLSQDADVVAHELTHGVTERSSGLIYQNESGALNEAWSDIFGALVDKQEGATGDAIWLIGEDVYTPNNPGDALRNMADPAAFGDYDYYPTRYTGTSDNGGVHWNSGIANLAFKLLVTGGSHPRGKTTNNVTGIGFEPAAEIFYNANVNCLTSSSNFAAARYCTADIFGGDHAASVHAAWDAVGVTNDPPAPPPEDIPLVNNEPLDQQSAETGVIQQYTLAGIEPNQTVTCSTSGNNGDADLYLRFGSPAEANPNSSVNACGSYSSTSNESCTTGAAPIIGTTLYAAVHAYAGYTDLTVSCSVNEPQSCLAKGTSCNTGSECCSGSCGGKPGSRTCK